MAASNNHSPTGRIQVKRNNQVAPAFRSDPALTSDEVWPSSIVVEFHRLLPGESEAAIGEKAGALILLDGPAMYQWSANGRLHNAMMPAGSVSTGDTGEPIPFFRWRQPIRVATVHLERGLLLEAADSISLPDSAFQQVLGYPVQEWGTWIAAAQQELSLGCPGGLLRGEMLGSAFAYGFLLRFSRHGRRPARQSGGLSGAQKRRTSEYILGNLDRDITLAELATVARISRFHFSRSFRSSFGIPPHQYLMQCRLGMAKEFLATSTLSLREIRERVGLRSASHFGAAFRARLGQTPEQYRRERTSRIAPVF